MWSIILKTITQWVVTDVIKLIWDGLTNLFIDWQAGREKRILAKATEDLKNAQTLEERRKAQDAISDNSF